MELHDASSRTMVPPLSGGALVRAAGAWVACGGLLKLFWGAPHDLPELLHGIMWPDPGRFLAFVIVIELFVAALALLSPRAGWKPVAALLTVFIGLSAIDVARGAPSCGCFGSAITGAPLIVLTINLILLATIVCSRPWHTLGKPQGMKNSVSPAVTALVIAILATALMTAGPPDAAARASHSSKDAGTGSAPESLSVAPDKANLSSDDASLASGSGDDEWRLPDELPRFVALQPKTWVDQRLAETELARWTDVSKFPADASIIFYMDTCPHCRDLLSERAHSPAELPHVLIRVPAPNRNFPVYVKDDVPAGLRVDLPRGTRWSIVVPWEVVVRGGVVESAQFHK